MKRFLVGGDLSLGRFAPRGIGAWASRASQGFAASLVFASLQGFAALADAIPLEPLGMQLDSPTPGQRVTGSVPLVEVSGRAAAPELYEADIVIAIDASNSTLLAAGVDVDRDGVVGKTRRWAKDGKGRGRPHRSWTTDLDDTAIKSELLVAQFVTEGLAIRRNRVGLLTYTGNTAIRARVGPPEAALAAIDRIKIREDWSGTDISRALDVAAQMLAAAPPTGRANRSRIVFLFSDGAPTVPSGEYWARRQALQKAAQLAEWQIRVCTFAFGEEVDLAFLSELAAATRCQLIPFEQPRDLIIDRVARSPRPMKLRIENLTSGEPARAVRLLPDGSFDAFARLVPGDNRIQVGVTLEDGRHVIVLRTVHYAPSETGAERDRLEAARLLHKLRRRTSEIEATDAERDRGLPPIDANRDGAHLDAL
jgi:hypothetical protein